MQPTRLTRNWKKICPMIRGRWEKLTVDDLSGVNGEPAKLVEAIRRRYHPGRSAITIEAKILDWLNRELTRMDEQGASSSPKP